MTVVVPPDLHKRVEEAENIRRDYAVTKTLETYKTLTDEYRQTISYIVTLGGDGTILWAAKQFNGCHVPQMITFSQGSLGFMCNFEFEDHGMVIDSLICSAQG